MNRKLSVFKAPYCKTEMYIKTQDTVFHCHLQNTKKNCNFKILWNTKSEWHLWKVNKKDKFISEKSSETRLPFTTTEALKELLSITVWSWLTSKEPGEKFMYISWKGKILEENTHRLLQHDK